MQGDHSAAAERQGREGGSQRGASARPDDPPGLDDRRSAAAGLDAAVDGRIASAADVDAGAGNRISRRCQAIDALPLSRSASARRRLHIARSRRFRTISRRLDVNSCDVDHARRGPDARRARRGGDRAGRSAGRSASLRRRSPATGRSSPASRRWPAIMPTSSWHSRSAASRAFSPARSVPAGSSHSHSLDGVAVLPDEQHRDRGAVIGSSTTEPRWRTTPS